MYVYTYIHTYIHTYIQDGELNVISKLTCVSTIYECMYNKCGDSDVEHNAMDTLVYKELNIPTASSQKKYYRSLSCNHITVHYII